MTYTVFSGYTVFSEDGLKSFKMTLYNDLEYCQSVMQTMHPLLLKKIE